MKLEGRAILAKAGVKQADQIIAEGLGGPDGYLRYLFINNLKEMTENPDTTIIYVPTEIGMPIQEATRLTSK